MCQRSIDVNIEMAWRWKQLKQAREKMFSHIFGEHCPQLLLDMTKENFYLGAIFGVNIFAVSF